MYGCEKKVLLITGYILLKNCLQLVFVLFYGCITLTLLHIVQLYFFPILLDMKILLTATYSKIVVQLYII